eukprot:274949-Prymnesium_polylepis.1
MAGAAGRPRVHVGHPLVDDRRGRLRLRRDARQQWRVHARAHRALVPVRLLLADLPHARLPAGPVGAERRHVQASAGLVRLQR